MGGEEQARVTGKDKTKNKSKRRRETHQEIVGRSSISHAALSSIFLFQFQAIISDFLLSVKKNLENR